MPKISVILPFFNAEVFLERSIRSILNQYFTDFELLLINNNSTDHSLNIAERFLKSDKRIKLLNENKQGVVFASKTGLEHSASPIIARADADDIWHPDKLHKQFNYLHKNPGTDVVSCRVNFKGPKENEGMLTYVNETNQYISHDEISVNRFSELQVINPTILFRKDIVRKNGFYREGEFPEDYEMYLRWLEAGVRYHKLAENLLDWYDHKNRLTRTDERYSTDAFYRIKAEYLARYLKKNTKHFPNIWAWGAGNLSKQRIQYLIDMGVSIEKYIDVDPKKINNKEIIHYEKVPDPGSCFIVSYVNNRGKRSEIRNFLDSRKYKEGADYIMA